MYYKRLQSLIQSISQSLNYTETVNQHQVWYNVNVYITFSSPLVCVCTCMCVHVCMHECMHLCVMITRLTLQIRIPLLDQNFVLREIVEKSWPGSSLFVSTHSTERKMHTNRDCNDDDSMKRCVAKATVKYTIITYQQRLMMMTAQSDVWPRQQLNTQSLHTNRL